MPKFTPQVKEYIHCLYKFSHAPLHSSSLSPSSHSQHLLSTTHLLPGTLKYFPFSRILNKWSHAWDTRVSFFCHSAYNLRVVCYCMYQCWIAILFSRVLVTHMQPWFESIKWKNMEVSKQFISSKLCFIVSHVMKSLDSPALSCLGCESFFFLACQPLYATCQLAT